MQNINIDDGYKEFSINNDPDRVVRFNPGDVGILERINTAYKEINKYKDNMPEDIQLDVQGDAVSELEQASAVVSEFRRFICEQIDYIFNSSVSEVVFGNQSPLSSIKGVPLYERFLNAVIPVIQKEIAAERKASMERMNKYISQVK